MFVWFVLCGLGSARCGLFVLGWWCHGKIVPGAKILPAHVIHSNPFQTCLATDDRSRRMTWKVLEHSQTRSLSATRQITLILQITFISVPNFIFVLYCIVFCIVTRSKLLCEPLAISMLQNNTDRDTAAALG